MRSVEDGYAVGSQSGRETTTEQTECGVVLRVLRFDGEVAYIFGPHTVHVVIEELLRDVDALSKRQNLSRLLVGDVRSRKRNRNGLADCREQTGTFVDCLNPRSVRSFLRLENLSRGSVRYPWERLIVVELLKEHLVQFSLYD